MSTGLSVKGLDFKSNRSFGSKLQVLELFELIISFHPNAEPTGTTDDHSTEKGSHSDGESPVAKRSISLKFKRTSTKFPRGSLMSNNHSSGTVHSSLSLKKSQNKLKRLKQLFRVIQDEGFIWPEIFNRRSLEAKNILDAQSVEMLKEIAQQLVVMFGGLDKKDEKSHGSNIGDKVDPSLKAALSLNEYLETHIDDVDNVLIGLKVSQPTIERYSLFIDTATKSSIEIPRVNPETAMEPVSPSSNRMYLSSRSTTPPMLSDSPQSTSSSSPPSPAPLTPHSSSTPTTPLTPHPSSTPTQLPYPNWASSNSSPVNRTTVKINPKKGDLILAKKDPHTLVFGRVLHLSKAIVIIALSPDEKKTSALGVALLRPLPPEMRLMISNVRQMVDLVEDPTEAVYIEMAKIIFDKARLFLSQNGIDVEMIDRVNHGKVPLCQLSRLQEAYTKLETLLMNPQSFGGYTDDVEAEAIKQLKIFTHNLDANSLLAPVRLNTLNQLQQGTFSKLAMNLLQSFMVNCDTAIDSMRIEIGDLINGNRKKRLTAWWLALIEKRCTDFLEAVGFRSDAIPEDYITDPPKDIAQVHENLRIVREILNPLQDKHNVQAFVCKLRDEIYHQIDVFVADAQSVLLSYLPEQYYRGSKRRKMSKKEEKKAKSGAIDKDETTEAEESVDLSVTFDVSRFEKAYLLFVEEFPQENRNNVVEQWITSTIKDLRYIESMKEMEQVLMPSSPVRSASNKMLHRKTRLEISTVVPLSGLILGRFHITENELMTVLDLWKHVPMKKLAEIASERQRGNSLSEPASPKDPKSKRRMTLNVASMISKTKNRSRRPSVWEKEEIKPISIPQPSLGDLSPSHRAPLRHQVSEMLPSMLSSSLERSRSPSMDGTLPSLGPEKSSRLFSLKMSPRSPSGRSESAPVVPSPIAFECVKLPEAEDIAEIKRGKERDDSLEDFHSSQDDFDEPEDTFDGEELEEEKDEREQEQDKKPATKEEETNSVQRPSLSPIRMAIKIRNREELAKQLEASARISFSSRNLREACIGGSRHHTVRDNYFEMLRQCGANAFLDLSNVDEKEVPLDSKDIESYLISPQLVPFLKHFSVGTRHNIRHFGEESASPGTDKRLPRPYLGHHPSCPPAFFSQLMKDPNFMVTLKPPLNVPRIMEPEDSPIVTSLSADVANLGHNAILGNKMTVSSRGNSFNSSSESNNSSAVSTPTTSPRVEKSTSEENLPASKSISNPALASEQRTPSYHGLNQDEEEEAVVTEKPPTPKPSAEKVVEDTKKEEIDQDTRKASVPKEFNLNAKPISEVPRDISIPLSMYTHGIRDSIVKLLSTTNTSITLPLFPAAAFKALFSHLPIQFSRQSESSRSGIVVAGTEEHLRHIFGDRLQAHKDRLIFEISYDGKACELTFCIHHQLVPTPSSS